MQVEEKSHAPTRELLTTEDIAALLTVPASTVERWRSTGYGPRRIRAGKHVRYRPCEVERWIAERER